MEQTASRKTGEARPGAKITGMNPTIKPIGISHGIDVQFEQRVEDIGPTTFFDNIAEVYDWRVNHQAYFEGTLEANTRNTQCEAQAS